VIILHRRCRGAALVVVPVAVAAVRATAGAAVLATLLGSPSLSLVAVLRPDLPALRSPLETPRSAVWRSVVVLGSGLLPLGSAHAAEEPSQEDIKALQMAFSAVRRLGDFPSRTSLTEAEDRLTDSLTRWRQRPGGAGPADEVSAILRTRALVKLRSGAAEAALSDLDAALDELKRLPKGSTSDEPPRVWMARGEALVARRSWKEALESYDTSAELMGEPIEDPNLFSERGSVKRRLGDFVGAVADFDAAEECFRRVGARIEAEIEAEKAGVCVIGTDAWDTAGDRLNGVIRRTIGLLSKEVKILQQVVIADVDARVAMAALSWHRGREEVAEAYWRDACLRLDALVDDAQNPQKGQGVAGFPDGELFRCDRYSTDAAWVQEVCGWPAAPMQWLKSFFEERRSGPPRASYMQDLEQGIPPGES